MSLGVITAQHTGRCGPAAFDGADDGRDIGLVGADGAARSSKTSQEQPEAVTSRQEQPGAVRSSQEEPGAARSSHEQTGAVRSNQDPKSNQEQSGAGKSSRKI